MFSCDYELASSLTLRFAGDETSPKIYAQTVMSNFTPPSFPPADAATRAAMLDWIRQTPLVYGPWQNFKRLYKEAEAAYRSDAREPEIVAALLARLDEKALESPGKSADVAVAGNFGGLCIHRGFAYVWSRGRELQTYDLSAPAQPQLVSTYLFNAMRGIHHREPGVAGAALAHPQVWVELIGDGIHVDPAVMRLAIRAKGVERVAVITDGGSFTGHPEGTFEEGERVVTVKDGKVALPDGTLAGSASPMNRNCLVLAEKVGMSWPEIAQMTSANPAKILGIEDRKGSLEVGKDADMVAVAANGDVLLTVVRGRIIYQKGESEAKLPPHVNT